MRRGEEGGFCEDIPRLSKAARESRAADRRGELRLVV
jgi:hypothetical protein